MDDKMLKEKIAAQFQPIIEAWKTKDIYAISFFVYDSSDNLFEPTVTLSYNTESHFKKSIPDASDEAEARWNFAFWLQGQDSIFGEDDESKAITKNWITAKGIEYIDFGGDLTDEQHDILAEIEQNGTIIKPFIKVLISIVQEWHKTGFIKKKFGKAIPVLIHELEYYDEIVEQNIKANGLQLVQGLADWLNGF